MIVVISTIKFEYVKPHGFYTILTQMCMYIDNDTKNLIELLVLRAEHSGLPKL